MSTTHAAKPKQTILVIEEGWVIMGERTQTGLANASVIRQWGTTKGLGEIALNGPTDKTVLDPCGDPIVPQGKILFELPCIF